MLIWTWLERTLVLITTAMLLVSCISYFTVQVTAPAWILLTFLILRPFFRVVWKMLGWVVVTQFAFISFYGWGNLLLIWLGEAYPRDIGFLWLVGIGGSILTGICITVLRWVHDP